MTEKIVKTIIILLLLTSCSSNKNSVNPLQTIVKKIITNGLAK